MSNEEEISQAAGSLILPVSDSNKLSYIRDLQERKRLLDEKVSFFPGDIVVWKSGMKNKTIPNYNEPGIVIELIDPPINDADPDIDSTYFNEQLDLKIGYITVYNEFVVFLHDSRRFTRYSY